MSAAGAAAHRHAVVQQLLDRRRQEQREAAAASRRRRREQNRARRAASGKNEEDSDVRGVVLRHVRRVLFEKNVPPRGLSQETCDALHEVVANGGPVAVNALHASLMSYLHGKTALIRLRALLLFDKCCTKYAGLRLHLDKSCATVFEHILGTNPKAPIPAPRKSRKFTNGSEAVDWRPALRSTSLSCIQRWSDTYGDTLPGLRFTVRYLRSTKLPGENALSVGRLLDDHVRQANEESLALDLASRDKLSALQTRVETAEADIVSVLAQLRHAFDIIVPTDAFSEDMKGKASASSAQHALEMFGISRKAASDSGKAEEGMDHGEESDDGGDGDEWQLSALDRDAVLARGRATGGSDEDDSAGSDSDRWSVNSMEEFEAEPESTFAQDVDERVLRRLQGGTTATAAFTVTIDTTATKAETPEALAAAVQERLDVVHRVYLRRTHSWTSELLGDWAFRACIQSHAQELRTKVKQLRQQLLDIVAKCKALGYTPTAATRRRSRSAVRKQRTPSGAGAGAGAASRAGRPRVRPSTSVTARRKRRATADPLGAALGLTLASAGPSKKRARKAKRKGKVPRPRSENEET